MGSIKAQQLVRETATHTHTVHGADEVAPARQVARVELGLQLRDLGHQPVHELALVRIDRRRAGALEDALLRRRRHVVFFCLAGVNALGSAPIAGGAFYTLCEQVRGLILKAEFECAGSVEGLSGFGGVRAVAGLECLRVSGCFLAGAPYLRRHNTIRTTGLTVVTISAGAPRQHTSEQALHLLAGVSAARVVFLCACPSAFVKHTASKALHALSN